MTRRTGGTLPVAVAALLFLLCAVAGAAEVRVLTTKEGLPSNRVTALAASPDGKLWVGTADAGVYLLDPAKGGGVGYRARNGLASDEVQSVAPFQGKVYVGTSAGLSVFDGRKWETIAAVQNVTMRNVRLGVSPDGTQLWASSFDVGGGTVRFDGKEWRFMGGEGRGLFNNVKGFAFLPEGVLMASWGGAPYLHKGDDVLPLLEGLPPANLLAAGTRGGKWVVGGSRGLFEFDGKWKEIRLLPGTPGFAVFDLSSAGDALYAGTVKGMFRLSGGNVSALSEADGLPDSVVSAVAAGKGYAAAGTARGLALVREW